MFVRITIHPAGPRRRVPLWQARLAWGSMAAFALAVFVLILLTAPHGA
jgi:hypothetical protein